MKVLMIECTAEELKANRTVMDCVSDALTNFTSTLCGVTKIDWSKLSESDGELEPKTEGEVDG